MRLSFLLWAWVLLLKLLIVTYCFQVVIGLVDYMVPWQSKIVKKKIMYPAWIDWDTRLNVVNGLGDIVMFHCFSHTGIMRSEKVLK